MRYALIYAAFFLFSCFSAFAEEGLRREETHFEDGRIQEVCWYWSGEANSPESCIRKEFYSWDTEERHIEKITEVDAFGNLSKEKFYFYNESGALVEYLVLEKSGEDFVKSSRTYVYDKKERLIQVVDGSTMLVMEYDDSGSHIVTQKLYQEGELQSERRLEKDPDGKTIHEVITDANHSYLERSYTRTGGGDTERVEVMTERTRVGWLPSFTPTSTNWAKNWNTVFLANEWFLEIALKIHGYLEPLYSAWEKFNLWRQQTEESAFYFRLIGGKKEVITGVAGHGEVSNKVRVTFTNGILVPPQLCKQAARFISMAHGDVNVHYVWHPTYGFFHDVFQGVYYKLKMKSLTALELVKTWRKLIKEMGGVNGGGKILHYAHSMGGLNTQRAHELLTAEERQMIEVVTLSSPALIDKTCFKKVTNYISWRDGVPYLDPLAYLQADPFHILRKCYACPDTNVCFIGDFSEGYPFVEHTMGTKHYRRLLLSLGSDFVEEHGCIL